MRCTPTAALLVLSAVLLSGCADTDENTPGEAIPASEASSSSPALAPTQAASPAEGVGPAEGLPSGFPSTIPLIGVLDPAANSADVAPPDERQWTIKMISPFTEGSVDEIAEKSASEAEEALLSAGYREMGENNFTNEQYEVGFEVYGQDIYYSIFNLNADAPTTEAVERDPDVLPSNDFDVSRYTQEQQQAFLALMHTDSDYLKIKGQEGTSDEHLLQYGAEGCHVASLTSKERIQYLQDHYMPLEYGMKWMRRWAIVHALHTLCPEYDFDLVMNDANKILDNANRLGLNP